MHRLNTGPSTRAWPWVALPPSECLLERGIGGVTGAAPFPCGLSKSLRLLHPQESVWATGASLSLMDGGNLTAGGRDALPMMTQEIAL